eukprot:TRINITY_DN15348_c0_g1_i1.p1 TRINITY_DN15348_c0_g1~~TRINITY_DN15348_c0_g1_i1.p1  ORF type:complete len:672 (-),score=120.14 TRINITY_DN15348_c0_g1_i1:69-2063(-)
MVDDWRCINTLKALSVDTVQKANSGHPGAPVGMSPFAYVLWTKIMRYSPANPDWINRDRFVLSNGHACALLYSLLHLTGYQSFTLDELKKFRQLRSKTPGHPECHFSGIEVTTGPLGQGVSNAVGLAIAQEHLGATFNKPGFEIFNNYTFVFVGDGCLQEGVSSESASLAGHLGLGRLIVLYDDNEITIDGKTELSFTEDVLKRYESYGWHTQYVANGDNDLASIQRAIEVAKKVLDRPSLIKIRTTIGKGSKLQGTEKVHGAPLAADDVVQLKQSLGLDPKMTFHVPEDVLKVYRSQIEKGQRAESEWNALFKQYSQKFPKEAAEISRRFKRELPVGWKDKLPRYKPSDAALATRQSSQKVLTAIGEIIPELIGGSADLTHSNLTILPKTTDFQKKTPAGRYIRYGVREHGMAAISNGLHAYGALIPFCATFLNFISYAYGAVTLSALSRHQVIYIMTHDSIGLGEDGPTHQPVEKLAACRALPFLLTFRPADGNEVSGAYAAALEHAQPSVIALSRQAVPNLVGSSIEAVNQGGYILSRPKDGVRPKVILVGTGTEVSLCVEAATLLEKNGVATQVVSFPCWELFEQQSLEYRQQVFIPAVPVVSVEAASTFGWSKYAHAHVGLETFGESGPAKDVYKYFGITADNIARKAEGLINDSRARL